MISVLLGVIMVSGIFMVMGMNLMFGEDFGVAGMLFGPFFLLPGLYIQAKAWKIFFHEINR